MILSKSYINKTEKGVKLLARWPLNVTQAKRKALAEELKPRDRLQKNPIKTPIETLTESESVDEEKVAISITRTTRKIYEPKSYNEVVNDLVYDRYWKKAIEKELQNFKSHQTWEYKELPIG